MPMDTFFGLHIPSSTPGQMALPLVVAVVLGGMVGLERELHGHPAGLRTHILVCVGSALMTIVSTHIGESTVGQRGDPARIAAQIVTGIGFLGAGAIMREGATIRGLTTAATVWTTAGIGIALGASPFLGELAVIATAIVLFTLLVVNWFEDRLLMRSRLVRLLEIHVRDTERASSSVLARLTAHNITITSVSTETGSEPHTRNLYVRLRMPAGLDRNAILRELSEDPAVHYAGME